MDLTEKQIVYCSTVVNSLSCVMHAAVELTTLILQPMLPLTWAQQ